MGRITVRLPEGVEADLDAYVDARDVDRETAVRRLLAERLTTWRAERATDERGTEEATFTRAAKEADRSAWKFARLVEARDAALVAPEDGEDDIDEE